MALIPLPEFPHLTPVKINIIHMKDFFIDLQQPPSSILNNTAVKKTLMPLSDDITAGWQYYASAGLYRRPRIHPYPSLDTMCLLINFSVRIFGK